MSTVIVGAYTWHNTASCLCRYIYQDLVHDTAYVSCLQSSPSFIVHSNIYMEAKRGEGLGALITTSVLAYYTSTLLSGRCGGFVSLDC